MKFKIEESFNISTATDQELADEYRRRRECMCEVRRELEARKFEICLVDGRVMPKLGDKTPDIRIRKEIRDVIEL